MSNLINNFSLFFNKKNLKSNSNQLKKEKNPIIKILLTLFFLFLFRFGNSIPLSGIDQEALKKSLFSSLQIENRNSIMQIINMYTGGGGNTLVSAFSLGIIPFINASILIDLLTTLVPKLEKLQSEEGEIGRKKLMFYKKIVAFFFAIAQSGFLIFYLQSYVYSANFLSFGIIGLELVTGAMIIIWLTSIIDTKGIGNGTSLIIFTNIVTTLFGKNIFQQNELNITFFLECLVIFFLIGLISISQSARINIEVISARQLALLENSSDKKETIEALNVLQLKENGLSIRLNQAGIFPIIIASNLLPFFINLFPDNIKFLSTLLYYLLIIGFNYFYTIVFWDPEKISEQLRKASVSVVNIAPGKETVIYLEQVVRSSSLLGGIFLCQILALYDLIKSVLGGTLLNQLNISSLIILVGVAYELQKTIRALYRNA
jgi:preprotein translocase subunit SecY